MITFDQIMENATQLTPLPQTVCKLAVLVADEKSTIDQIVAVFEYDQVLTAMVLRYANSVESASQRRIDTVRNALIRMGSARILERIIASHVQSVMKKPIVGYGFYSDELWRHSVAAAVVAESLGSFTGTQTAGISFTAALLHDLGKLLLGRLIGDTELKKMLQSIDRENNEVFEAVERQLFGYSHAQIGAQICASWNLPECIVKAIRNHHHVSENDDVVSDSVRLSNLGAKIIGEGIGHEGMAFVINEACAQRFGFSKESFESFCAGARYRFNEVIESFNI
jgi:putative nucleotidyltransferase with HDIG domain